MRIGNELAFDLTVHNAGPSDATGIVVTDTLPAGLEYVSSGESGAAWTVTADPVATDGTTTITATLDGSLAVGDTAPVLEIVTLVHPEAYSDVVNVADVVSTEPDEDPEDNTTEDHVIVPPLSTLVITKDAVGTFEVGSQGTYVITVRNDGPTEDPGPITVTDALSEGLGFVGADAGAGACEHAGATVTCELDEPLPVEGEWTITLRVAVGQAAFPEVVNTAVVDSPTEQTPDGVPSDTVTTPVEADPLAATGGAVPLVLLAAGIPLLVLGALLLLRRRRQVMTADNVM